MDILIDLSHYRGRLSTVLAESSKEMNKAMFEAFIRFSLYYAERKGNKISRVDNFLSACKVHLDLRRESYLKLQVLATKAGELIYNTTKDLYFERLELHASHLGLFYVIIRL